jgi:hypothetical protein
VGSLVTAVILFAGQGSPASMLALYLFLGVLGASALAVYALLPAMDVALPSAKAVDVEMVTVRMIDAASSNEHSMTETVDGDDDHHAQNGARRGEGGRGAIVTAATAATAETAEAAETAETAETAEAAETKSKGTRGEGEREGPAASGAPGVVDAVKGIVRILVVERTMWLLLPTIFFLGNSLGWFWGDFLGILVARSLGRPAVAGASLFFYVSSAACSAALGRGIKHSLISRRWALRIAALLYVCLWGSLCFWSPPLTGEKPSVATGVALFTLVLLFALADTVNETLVPGIVQNMFANDAGKLVASQGVFKVFQSAGFTVQFLIGGSLPDNGSPTVTRNKSAAFVLFFLASFLLLLYFDLRVLPIDPPKQTDQTSSPPSPPAGAPPSSPPSPPPPQPAQA